MTKIYIFCYPIYDLTKHSIANINMTVVADTIASNISYEGLLLMVLLMMKE